jgi:hypothetical protein
MTARPGLTPALGVLAAVLAAGCGSTVVTLGGSPVRDLLRLDQLPSPDFTVYQAVAPTGAGWLDPGSAAVIADDGFVAAAQVEYYRPIGFATSNGPITLTAAAARFSASQGAAAALATIDAALDARPGAIRLTIGRLGDSGHAISVGGTVDGVQAIEIVVVWRVDNLIDSLVAEGRLGGLQVGQLLPLAASQTADEAG